jgi:hypothetical protein
VLVQTVSQNALYWLKLNSQHIRNFNDSDFCVLWTSSVTLIDVLIRSACWWTS